MQNVPNEISRRTILNGVATGAGGLLGGRLLNPGGRAVAAQETQTETDEHAEVDLAVVTTTDDVNEDFEYSEQYEFSLGSDVYVIAEVENLVQEGEVRFAYDTYVLGGAGVVDDFSRVVLTDVSYETGDWMFWNRIETDSEVTEYASWVQGEYTVVVTVTDFLSRSSVTGETGFRLA